MNTYSLFSALLGLGVLSWQGPAASTFQRAFTYRADRDLNSVAIAGTFNNWDKGADPMSHSGRLWTKTLQLPLGKIQYKFVIDGNNWITDPSNSLTVDDGNGHTNSLLVVLPPDYSTPAAKGDGRIASSALYHDSTASYLNFDRGQMQFSLRVRPDDIETVELMLDGKLYPLHRVSSDDMYEKDEVSVPWDRKTDLSYNFLLQDGKLKEYFGPNGISQNHATNDYHVSAASFKPFVVPQWPEHSVIYQIFPDRFADGDKSNDPPDVMPWDGKPSYSNFFGGDIAGIEQHLDYLKSLGIRAVYFNPIFASPANHRYATTDYFKVDPRFGTNAEFVKLCQDLHADGIKVVLDGVFNHTDPHFFAFQDIMDKGADSKYTNWYFIKSYPVRVVDPPPYVGWFGYASLPKLHIDNPDTERYMLSIPTYWDQVAHIDGWRLDAANEVVDSYWKSFRDKVKENDPDRWILGEVWGDGNHWLGGDMWDSIMGYQFRQIALDFIPNGSIKPSVCMERLMDLYYSYPPQVSRNLMNLIGSHDTERFLTLCHGDKKLAELGAAIQLTWPGAPSVYYGDEIGMEGGRDPDDRRPMRWDRVTPQNEILTEYKELIHARDESPALETGDPIDLYTDDSKGTFAYGRTEGNDFAVVAVNRSGESRSLKIPLDHRFVATRSPIFEDVLTGRRYPDSNGELDVSLGPEGSAVLLPVTEAEAARETTR